MSAGVLALFSMLALLPGISIISWLISHIPQIPTDADPQKLSTAIIGLLYSMLALRWAIEMRRCRIAQTCLALATLFALASQLDLVKIFSLSSYLLGQIISNSLFFLAIHAGLLGLLFYGRHVRFDALGLLATKKRGLVKKKTAPTKRKTTVEELEQEENVEEDTEETDESEQEEESEEEIEIPVVKKKVDAVISRQNNSQSSAKENHEEIDFRELSKAERKKMRRDRRGE
jgi:hypothetical protein